MIGLMICVVSLVAGLAFGLCYIWCGSMISSGEADVTRLGYKGGLSMLCFSNLDSIFNNYLYSFISCAWNYNGKKISRYKESNASRNDGHCCSFGSSLPWSCSSVIPIWVYLQFVHSYDCNTKLFH